MAGIPPEVFYLAAILIMLFSFWFSVAQTNQKGDKKRRLQLDLLSIPVLRTLLLSRPLKYVLRLIIMLIFLFIIIAGLFGRQTAGGNIATVLTWSFWWLLLIPFAFIFGSVWCYLCPWDTIASGLARIAGRHSNYSSNVLKWPGLLRNIYPALMLFILLTWLELGMNVTASPQLTALLGLTILLLAVFGALFWARRHFCRYGCLVGRICGFYSLLSPIELRVKSPLICKQNCSTKDCLTGNSRGAPCPTFQFPEIMNSNTYCLFCGECLHSCTNENIALNLRPFGRDLGQIRRPRTDEAIMVIALLALSSFHGLTMTPAWFQLVRWIQDNSTLSYGVIFTLLMLGIIMLVGGFYLVVIYSSYWLAGSREIAIRQIAITMAYGFLPIAVFYHLAHNLMHFGLEFGALIPLISDPFGWGWDLFDTANRVVGPILAPATIWFGQATLIIIGHVWAIFAGHNTAGVIWQDKKKILMSQLPILVAMIVYSLFSLWLVAQPMAMRTAY